MEEYKFESIYQFINIVYKSVKNEVELWGYDKEEFIKSVSKFSKKISITYLCRMHIILEPV